MDKNYLMLKIYGTSGILGFLSEIFANSQTSYLILLVLIILDTFTGIFTAIKYKRFSSRGLRKTTKKIITYTLCIITVSLLEVILNPLVTTTMLSQIIIAFLAITESISILENLTQIGVPIPANFLPILIKSLKIPGLNVILDTSVGKEKEISDIDDIINYTIPTFGDKNMRTFLEIKYNSWKSIVNQIMLIDETGNNPDILYYKILSLIELGLTDMDKNWNDEKIKATYIDNFSKKNKFKIDKCIEKLKPICDSGKSTKEKKEEFVDCIIIMLYQIIIDARKSL